MLGRFSRAIAITHAGMFLSQPPIATRPSKPSQPMTVSMLSAMTSRETSEYFMPSVPIEMPSEMVIVPKITPFAPAVFAPASACRARPSMCMLHGVTMDQVLAMPICDFLKSSRANPTAWSIARLAARSAPSTTSFECSRWRLTGLMRLALREGALGLVVIKGDGKLAGSGELWQG